MNLRFWIPLLLIGVVAWFAGKLGFDAIERDRADRVASERRFLDESADELAREWDRLLATRVEAVTLEGGGTRLWLEESGEVSVEPPLPPPSTEVDEALAIGDRLLRGGEPERAVDAYTFRLPPEGPDRDRLLWAATQAAREVDALLTWRAAVLRQLAETPRRASIGSVPIDLLAALTLRNEFDQSPAALERANLEGRLESLEPVGFAAVLRGLGPAGEPLLERTRAFRRTFDRVAEHAEPLLRGDAVLLDRWLLLPSSAEGEVGRWVTAVSLGERLPTAPRGVTVQRALAGAPPFIHLAGTPIASLRLEDPALDVRVAEFARRAERWQLGWGIIVVIVALAAITTWRALERKRRLAALRMRLLANVSHELKTPVTSLRMFGELLESGQLPPERVPEFGGRITTEAKRLGTRIEQILETAQAEGGTPLETDEWIALPDLVNEVADGFRGRLATEGSALTIQASSDSTAVRSNRDALERILENLIDNALKYGRSKDGADLAVTVTAGDRRAEVSVADRGPGISRADRERIFEPFYRAHFDDFATSGTGLGLSISRQFAERLGGTLRCADRSDGGTVFTLSLPAAEARAPEGGLK